MENNVDSIQPLIAALESSEFVKNVKLDIKGEERVITSVFIVDMPSRAKAQGQSVTGVKTRESVSFHLPDHFPYEAPIIKFRRDFPRNFPHLNPSGTGEVLPCVYEGNLNELYQNANGPNLLIFQIKNWLEKAARGELIDPTQGWEPMRADTRKGSIEVSSLELEEIRKEYAEKLPKGDWLGYHALYEKSNEFISCKLLENGQAYQNDDQKTLLLVFETPDTIETYSPSEVNKLSDLFELADSYGVTKIKKHISDIYRDNNPNVLLVSLAIKRLYNIINPYIQSKYEYLFFAIHCKPKGREKTEIYDGSRITSLHQIESVSTQLLQSLSGKPINTQQLYFVGCGSLGSKLALHLAKAGCDNFTLIDPDIFWPHNNARHGATFNHRFFKTTILAHKIQSDLKRNVIDLAQKSIMDYPLENFTYQNLIVDSTASLAVRNYLSTSDIKSPTISVSLFNHSRMGLMLIEDAKRATRIDDLAAFCQAIALEREDFAKHYTANHLSDQRIGLGCSSYTTVCSDADISLLAAGMANKIQTLAASEMPKTAQICFGIVSDDNMSIAWESIDVANTVTVKKMTSDGIEVRIIGNIANKIREDFDKYLPNETGGILVGHMSMSQKKIYITSLIEAPNDSKRSPTFFELGTNGLSESIYTIDTCAMPIRALGTWHSHPKGGGPSAYDITTKKKIEAVLGQQATCCLIVDQSDFYRF